MLEVKNICKQENMLLQLTFYPGLTLTGIRTTRPWTLLSPARVQPLYGARRKESSGTGLRGRTEKVGDDLGGESRRRAESAKTGDDNCNLTDLQATDYALTYRTPQILKKSGINNVCAEKQSAVRVHYAISEKEEPALIAVSWRNNPQKIFSTLELIPVSFIFFILYLKI